MGFISAYPRQLKFLFMKFSNFTTTIFKVLKGIIFLVEKPKNVTLYGPSTTDRQRGRDPISATPKRPGPQSQLYAHANMHTHTHTHPERRK